MSRNSPFLAAGRPMGSFTSGTSYRNDNDCYVDDKLVKKLVGKRNSVMQLMNKAEEKQFTEPDIKEWLVSIKHTIYDSNALLDKIHTEERFREKYKEDGFGSPSYSISEFVKSATSEINRIIEELKDRVEDAGDMGLKARDEGAAASAQQIQVRNDRVTSPVLSKSTIVYGREEEKAGILKRVLYSPESAAPGNKPEVIAIVGMGGLGKTTLAQYVYNHADVEGCFTMRSWACVSDNFDLVRVTRAILESLTEAAAGVCDLASLQRQLEKQLTGKRFLVVLDDTWDFSKQNWEKLMAPFSTGAAGSKIILTTRDTRVAGVAPADHSFQLKKMSEDEAWSLFSCEVFGDGELSQHPKLEAIGKEIVMKCRGLPLAVKTLSGLLRSERKEVEWERVRESSLWQLPEGQKDIIPALGLSYSYLPSHLKTCFAYCSLFPKDCRFRKIDLVNLWVDEGFLQQPNDNRSIEDVGVVSFDDLSSRSFFTQYYEEVYVMHDLIHDLAQMVFADFHQQLNGHKAVKECKKVRHISFHDTGECGGSSMKFEVLNQAESLQTFMVSCEFWKAPRWGLDDRILYLLLQQFSLRVLCLRGAWIRTLPDRISALEWCLLRCLDVSYTDVYELPASLCKLYNLRSLLCWCCDQLKEFHYDMAAFVSLRHFTLSGRQLEKAPWNFSQLSRVKLKVNLPYSVGDGSDSLGSRDTKEGSVNVAIVDGANVSDSGDKQEGEVDVALHQAESDSNVSDNTVYVGVQINELSFVYSGTGEVSAGIQSDLLESLRPHRDVKEVCIKNFNGTEFPGWLVDRSYRNIEKVALVNCWISSGLMPALGGLPSLKHLLFEAVRNVKKLGSELYNSTVPFGSLEKLSFRDMKEWEEWEPSDGAYPRLQKLSIVRCPKWKGRLPSNLPSLEELRIEEWMDEWEEWGPSGAYPRLLKLRIVGLPYSSEEWDDDEFLFNSSLRKLVVWRCENLKTINGAWLRSFTSLQELSIYNCDKLESLPYSSDVDDCSSDDEFRMWMTSLRKLVVSECVNLKTINGAWLRSFTSLQELTIYNCHKLEALPEEGLPRSLTKLCLCGFKNLRRQDWIVIQNLSSLEELEIAFCRELKALPVKLPCSLTKLCLSGFKNLRRQDWIAIQNLTSLEELEIEFCRELKALPVKLPCSLKRLYLFQNHRDLKERCKRDTGPD